MKVKIVKCSGDYWYRDRIGLVFEIVEEVNPLFYRTVNIFNEILKSDCVEVNEIKYELGEHGDCITKCLNKDNIERMVGSFNCDKCNYSCGHDEVNQIVECAYKEEDNHYVKLDKNNKIPMDVYKENKVKKLNIREYYKDDKICIKDGITSRLYIYSELGDNGNSKASINLTNTSIEQTNQILKIYGLDYELVDETDWSKVEVGARLSLTRACLSTNRMTGKSIDLGNLKFKEYVKETDQIILFNGNKVEVYDASEVELC